jgi:hypothetical protein
MPNDYTYGFSQTDADSLINIIGSSTTEVAEIVRLPGSPTIKHAYPPSGGIPAAAWDSDTETMTPGTATCRIAVRVGGAYEPATSTVLVENPVGAIVGSSGKPITIGRNTSGAWTVLVEDCTGTSGPVTSSSLAFDPADGGGSRGLDPGYKIGV